MSKEEDPRRVELSAVNQRLKTVFAFLKTKHTSESLNTTIEQAESRVGDHTAAYVPMENAILHGTRHVGALLQLAEVLELKGEIGHADHAFEECRTLLERKVAILKQIYKQ